MVSIYLLVSFFYFQVSQHQEFSLEDDYDFLMEKVLKYRYDNLDTTIYFLDRLENLAEQKDNPKMKIEILYLRGGAYYISGDYLKAQTVYDQAYQLAEQINDPLEKAKVLNGRGLVFLGQEKYDQAIQIWKEALAIFQSNKSLELQPNLLFNIGLAYSQLKQFEVALEWLQKALAILEIEENLPVRDMVINRMGKVNFDMGDYYNAQMYYEKLLAREAEISTWEKTFLYAGLAELELRNEEYQKAIFHAEESFNAAVSMNALWDQERALKLWSQALENAGDYPKALEIARLNKDIADSLFNTEKEREINFLQLQVVEAENKQLFNENELILQKSRVNQQLNLGLAIVVLLLVLLIFSYRRSLKVKENFSLKLEKLNHELAEKKELVTAQNESLNQINESKNKLFSILSHDLRSPIGNLKSFLKLDRMGVFEQEEREEALTLIEEQLGKTDKLLENLLQWASTQMKGLDPNPEKIDVSHVMDEVISQFDYQLMLKGIEMKHQMSTDNPVYAKVDENNLRVILFNILSNAIKFTPKEGQISIFYTTTTDHLKVHVRDSGEGMDPEKRERLENDFSMITSSQGTEEEKGTGLGLLLVKQLLVYNGGFLKVNSEYGRGTEMVIHLKKHEEESLAN
ncbi:tetratricopeptide repeat-containing sensor histidine kinase [Mongoliibacter ruber]|uniref:histidine kinase n=1 Tax=Mongoliibacter ruber TaxID=1750599 RepID=A0A2T0WW31_9BACT|nr:tetratricopeptide repeat-containing sensor histidine kinase [Mongoliibacter ruber]PRY90898.1 signal transduction histidine kinase [Mongoliibacter ruber]